MNIEITPEIEHALTREADKQGTTPELLALDALRERFVAPRGNGDQAQPEGTLADYLAGHVGVLSSGEHVAGGAGMSTECGKKFTAILTASLTN